MVVSHARATPFVVDAACCADWGIGDAQEPNSLNFQDNWDEDANDKDFIAQLRKELGK
jgi:hypothetical protein